MGIVYMMYATAASVAYSVGIGKKCNFVFGDVYYSELHRICCCSSFSPPFSSVHSA